MITATVDVRVVREVLETVTVEIDESDIVYHYELESAEDITSEHVSEFIEDDVWADIPHSLNDIREVQSISVEAVEI